jgi:hypothetical protein
MVKRGKKKTEIQKLIQLSRTTQKSLRISLRIAKSMSRLIHGIDKKMNKKR